MGNRQCTVEIENNSQYNFCNPHVYTLSGYHKDLPLTIGPSESRCGQFLKTSGTARGAVGVFTYDLQIKSTERDVGKMAVMFSVPYDYNIYSNWYAVGVFDMRIKCDHSLFNDMYYNPERGFFRAKAKDSLTYRSKAVTIRATMSDSCKPVIKIQVSPGSKQHNSYMAESYIHFHSRTFRFQH
ncbi:DELTA-sagatoxin-Srs1a-like [Micropterus salmoides]|uniref:DELTA-sagatoxin-Srs1a-like n=1 Tax=Micropterus salmoides TaxID=27706 RepID=UPI0018EAECDB|nr:DELTA-sagatoxin-Srs1a-like [Micropterus salmoides]XP_038565997.1 DELTA-sagatoxin-Srs1a-like [Micropterus salmoides]